VRLNLSSDIRWEEVIPEVFYMFEHFTFYDYTKIPERLSEGYKLPPNYSLVFSRSEINEDIALDLLSKHQSVAVVFKKKDGKLPETWKGYPVVDGDLHDATFMHPPGTLIGLEAAYGAEKDTTGFAVEVNDECLSSKPQ
jgi:hypothetical protein